MQPEKPFQSGQVTDLFFPETVMNTDQRRHMITSSMAARSLTLSGGGESAKGLLLVQSSDHRRIARYYMHLLRLIGHGHINDV